MKTLQKQARWAQELKAETERLAAERASQEEILNILRQSSDEVKISRERLMEEKRWLELPEPIEEPETLQSSTSYRREEVERLYNVVIL
mmetsp:Transcript_23521/g.36795  ORF Transcript_23521/g.36795 Transcript_23521/m.36795 type:complete len:89 (+) Transcript_23521:319-585(+)